MRGRKPKPIAIRKLEGNPGKRPLPTSDQYEARALDHPPPAPSSLNATAAAEWQRLAIVLHATRVLAQSDLGLLHVYATTWDEYLTATKKLKKQGYLTRSRDGGCVRNPWFLIRAKLMDTLIRVGAELALSPSSRTRLAMTAPDPNDPAEKFFTSPTRGAR